MDRIIEETVEEDKLDLEAYETARQGAADVIKDERQSKNKTKDKHKNVFSVRSQILHFCSKVLSG